MNHVPVVSGGPASAADDRDPIFDVGALLTDSIHRLRAFGADLESWSQASDEDDIAVGLERPKTSRRRASDKMLLMCMIV